MNRVFQLRPAFLASYQSKKPSLGFKYGGFSELVLFNAYSRPKLDGTGKESWFDCIQRVTEGTFSMLKRLHPSIPWCDEEMEDRAEAMFECFFNMRALPPGRGLFAMGSELTETRELYAALNNCAFVSTKPELSKNLCEPFKFMLDASMLGIGVGFDTELAGRFRIPGKHQRDSSSYEFVIPDSREGWVKALELLLSHYLYGTCHTTFNYSEIRPAGTPIRGFGGVCPGYKPLKKMLDQIEAIFLANQGKMITSTIITDVMNIIGCCVVAGNIRRSAQIAFGHVSDKPFLNLKNPDNPRMQTHGWASNNSIFAYRGMDYLPVCERICHNGEPGLLWLENARKYGRIQESEANFSDIQVRGTNPCAEQMLENMELCCLGEIFLPNLRSPREFEQTIDQIHLYCKIVTLGKTPWATTNKVIAKNRRMGISVTGFREWLAKNKFDLDSRTSLFFEKAYDHVKKQDQKLNKEYGFPLSNKLTTVKPSGTVSIVVGVTPGLHAPIARVYKRRVRVAKDTEIYRKLKDFTNARLVLEDCVLNPDHTAIITFYVKEDANIVTEGELSVEQQLEAAAFLQRHWSDNGVSCTVKFDPAEYTPKQLADLITKYETQLKGISFLPMAKDPNVATVYAQMPYEAISDEEYDKMTHPDVSVKWSEFFKTLTTVPPKEHRFCDGPTCERPQ